MRLSAARNRRIGCFPVCLPRLERQRHHGYPALDADGAVVFWRDGKLQTISQDLQGRELLTCPDKCAAMSRILLIDDGQVIFALDDEVLIFSRAGLAALDCGPWFCAEGNLPENRRAC